jgi:HEAT repeat protein
LDDIHWFVRLTALDLLIESDPEAPASFEVAVRSLSDPDWDVRSAALRLIATYWPDEPRTLSHLASASRDYNPANRKAALEALLIAWPRHPVTQAALVNAEAGVSIFVSDFAYRSLIRLQPGHCTTEMRAVTPRSSALEQLQQADLYRPDDPASRRLVLDLVRSADWRIRDEALCVLARRWPDWSETDLALGRALDDENSYIRRTVLRELTGKFSGSPATVPMLRRAAREPNPLNRENAVGLLRLWRSAEAHAGLLEAARDQDLGVHNTATLGLVTGWAIDDRTYDALGWSACSSFDWLHNLAYDRLNGGKCDTAPDRATLLAAQRVPDLLSLALWWGEDPDVEVVLRERLRHHDILRAGSLTAILARSGEDAATRSLLVSSAQDECPAVRRLALEGLIRMRDPAWTGAAISDPDPFIRYNLFAFRSVTEKSPLLAIEIIDVLSSDADGTFLRWVFFIAAVFASGGLLEPAVLAEATRDASYLDPGDVEWLQWLVRNS